MSDVIRFLGPQDMQARNQMAQRQQTVDQLRSQQYQNIFDYDMPDMQAQMQDLSRAYQAEAQRQMAPGRADDVLAQRERMPGANFPSVRDILLDSGTNDYDAKAKELMEYYQKERRKPRQDPFRVPMR